MSITADDLFRLLPAHYRSRDTEEGGPLKALINVLAREAGIMDRDIEGLYENRFIETCDEWVVPYIGDLLGIRGLQPVGEGVGLTRRAYVANTIRYRRRKGTAPVLEQLAYDTTGWRARVVEFFQLLGWTQNINHVRRHNHRTPDIRRTGMLELLDTPFGTIAHTVDVRRIDSERGKHNISNIGLFLWRMQSYPLIRAQARHAQGQDARCFTFNQLGMDAHLFNRPQTETQITHLAEEINVPGTLRRRPLYDELEARRQALVEGKTPSYVYFDDRPDTLAAPVFEIYIDGDDDPVDPAEILICNLEDWHLPPASKNYKNILPNGTQQIVPKKITVAVDPVLGRLTFHTAVNQVEVTYAYGFSSDVGGGPYNRQTSIISVLPQNASVDWHVWVSKAVSPEPGKIFNTLLDAVTAWNLQPSGRIGVISIMDNNTYEDELTGSHVIEIPEGSKLIIVGAEWPDDITGSEASGKRCKVGEIVPEKSRPHILGNISIKGTAGNASETPGQLVLDGLLVEGRVKVLAGNLGKLRIAHCTLVPKFEQESLRVKSSNLRSNIELYRTICGAVSLISAVPTLTINECIVDNGDSEAVLALSTAAAFEKSTVIGIIKAQRIEAGNSIFTGNLTIERRQTGCIRFSFVPDDSQTPRKYRCQPFLEIGKQIEAAEEIKGSALDIEEESAIKNNILDWLAPAFTSRRYGHYGYAQLARACPQVIKTGADDGAEMGVFNHLKQPQRESLLRSALDEYLRFGLEAGIFYVN